MTFLIGCGEPRERTGATSSARTSPAYKAFDASAPPGMAVHLIALADTAASATSPAPAYTPRPTRSPVAVGKRKSESSATVHDALSSFELVGTAIDGTNAFAVVRTPDDSVVTVREGGVMGRYTVRSIQPDRIRLTAPDQKEAMLLIGASGVRDGPFSSTADMAPSETDEVSAFVAAGINIDQSLPEHVFYGPTAHWPEGEKHIH